MLRNVIYFPPDSVLVEHAILDQTMYNDDTGVIKYIVGFLTMEPWKNKLNITNIGGGVFLSFYL